MDPYKKVVHRLKVAQRAMGLSLLDRMPNVEIRNRTGITDSVQKSGPEMELGGSHMSKGGRAVEPSDSGLARWRDGTQTH
ncbi:jg17522 [Pararge aegeria aegeria]|uniref:Jg17522 protein n=1 Tax=Pararge aegeria aegeria TaxID=348720 RepID=A0A8S4S7H9_9NEOP|nr:jg17522 [Pararge aegeria aegeria]